MNDSIIKALLASFLGGGPSGGGSPQQNAQGPMGMLGAAAGRGQGPVGAIVPQNGGSGAAGGLQGGAPMLGPGSAPAQRSAPVVAQGAAPQQTGGQQNAGGGLAALLPALVTLIPIALKVLHAIGSMQQGGGAQPGAPAGGAAR
jgi:hypothetical protein